MEPTIKESASALARGADFLNRPGIQFGQNRAGYEYKHWTPIFLPFIQASTGIWAFVTDGWQGGMEHLPFNQFIPAGGSFDFQIFTPRDHPFLLMDVKVAATRRTTEGEDPPVTTIHSRWKNIFDLATQPYLFKKYAMPDDEGVETTLIAVSPGGKPVWGGVQNVVGLDNSVRTVGPVPHVERIPLGVSQNHASGKGSLQHHLLFPPDGIIRVTVEDRNLNGSSDPATPDGIHVNGVCFGYVIME
jgi:hypothetical protein